MPLHFRVTFMTPPPSYFYRLGNWVHVSTPRAVWAQSLCFSLGPCPVPKRHWSPPPVALWVKTRVSVSDLVCVLGGSKAPPASPQSACHTHRHLNVSWGAKRQWPRCLLSKHSFNPFSHCSSLPAKLWLLSPEKTQTFNRDKMAINLFYIFVVWDPNTAKNTHYIF